MLLPNDYQLTLSAVGHSFQDATQYNINVLVCVILAILPTMLQAVEYLAIRVRVGKLKAVETFSFKHFNWLYGGGEMK